jgi:hypothetical protein
MMNSPELQDRLYINDGKGNFQKDTDALPAEVYSGSCVVSADYDNDGDMDLFVGASSIPGLYPLSTGNMILRNDFDKATHHVSFTNVTKSIAGDSLIKAGMVSSAAWVDVDKDGLTDLVITGEWMPVKIFHNTGHQFVDISAQSGLEKTNGWWCSLLPADVDNDGDIDFIIGNMGTNTQFKVNEDQPLITYADDFDNNGKIDPVMTWYIQGVSYPFNSRDEIVGELPALNKKFIRYANFGKATIDDILSKEQIEKARKFYVYTTQTSILVNNKGKFELKQLPVQAQFSPVNGILFKDYDGDGKNDILLAGNFYPFRVQQGRCDAGLGCLLKGDGKGNFIPVNREQAGFCIRGDVRDMIELKKRAGSVILISKNNAGVQAITRN